MEDGLRSVHTTVSRRDVSSGNAFPVSLQVTVEATLEHPFFVFGQGWSSCDPERTMQRFGLRCQRLSVGDVCISLTHKDTNTSGTEVLPRLQQQQQGGGATTRGEDTRKPTSQISHTLQQSAESSSGALDRERPARSAPPPHRTCSLLAAEERSAAAGHPGGTALTDRGSPAATSGSNRPESDEAQSQPPGSGTQPRKRRWSAPDQLSAEEGPIDVVGGTSPQPSPAASPLPSSASRTETSSPGREDQGQSQVKQERSDSSDD